MPVSKTSPDAALTARNVTMHRQWIFYSERTYEEAGLDVAAQFLALPREKHPLAL